MSTITFTFTYSLFSSSLWRPGKIVKSIQKWLLEQSSPKWPVNFPAQKEPVKCLTKRGFHGLGLLGQDGLEIAAKKEHYPLSIGSTPPQPRMPLYISRVCDSYKILKKPFICHHELASWGPGGKGRSQLYIPRYLVVVPLWVDPHLFIAKAVAEQRPRPTFWPCYWQNLGWERMGPGASSCETGRPPVAGWFLLQSFLVGFVGNT